MSTPSVYEIRPHGRYEIVGELMSLLVWLGWSVFCLFVVENRWSRYLSLASAVWATALVISNTRKALKLHPACRDVADVSVGPTGIVLGLTDGRRLDVSSVKFGWGKILFTAEVPGGEQVVRTLFAQNYGFFLRRDLKEFLASQQSAHATPARA